jgi:hypothetical protein
MSDLSRSIKMGPAEDEVNDSAEINEVPEINGSLETSRTPKVNDIPNTALIRSKAALAKAGWSALSLGQKVRGAGLAIAWGTLGEAAGQVLGFFIHITPTGLGHACGTALASLCAIYLARGRPITLKDCLRALLKNHHY